MYVISKEGHMGYWWEGNTTLFVEEDSALFPSRADCLAYLEKYHPKEIQKDLDQPMKTEKNIQFPWIKTKVEEQ